MPQAGKLCARSKSGISLIMVGIILGAALQLGAGPAVNNGNLSVGDFAVLVASRLQAVETTQAPLNPESAVLVLQKAGIKVRSDLAAPATEGDAADLFRQVGIVVEPQNAENPLHRERAQSLVSIFGSTLAARSGPGLSQDTASKEQITGSSRTALPAAMTDSIADCQGLPKTQDCVLCCRNLLGGGSQNDTHTNRICGKACNSKARNVCPEEPTP